MHYPEEGHSTEEIQATTVNIKTTAFKVSITAIYCPPRHALKRRQYVEFLSKLGYRFIGGDLNAKHTNWGSRLVTIKGKELLEACKQLKCDILSTGRPTYWLTDLNRVPDLLDFFLVKNVSINYLHIEEA